MYTLITPKRNSMTGYNTETCRVHPVHGTLIKCGERVFVDMGGHNVKWLYGKDRHGVVWEILWPNQYKLTETEKAPWDVNTKISFADDGAIVTEPEAWYKRASKAISTKLSHWLWYWTPQGLARD